MADASYAPVWVGTDGYDGECSPWAFVSDSTLPMAGTDSTMSCAPDGCIPISQNEMPSELLSGLTKGALAASPYWVQYYLTIVCYITLPAPPDPAEAITIPGSAVKVAYAFEAAPSGVQLTDALAPPFVTFETPPITVTPTVNASVSFELQARLAQLGESNISRSTTISELFLNPDALLGITDIAYDEAFAFMVQLRDPIARKEWTVAPAVILMAAHAGVGPSTSVMNITAGAPLTTSFCGLDMPELAGAWAIVDAGSLSGAASGPDALVDAAQWVANGGAIGDALHAINVTDALTPDLVATLTALVTNNSFSDISSLQSDILGSTVSSAVAVIPDGSGGFALPARNRFFMDDATLAGYSVSFCAITVVKPYSQLRAGVWFPVYTNAAAALSDTGSVNGAILAPMTIRGTR